MKRFLVVLVGALLISADKPDKAEVDVQEELKQLKGPWVYVGGEAEGKWHEMPREARGFIRMEITKDIFKQSVGGKEKQVSYSLHLAGKQKAMNFSGELVKAIYSIDRDILKICCAPPFSGRRPTSFKTSSKNDWYVEVWGKEKGCDPKVVDLERKELSKLQGTWRLVGQLNRPTYLRAMPIPKHFCRLSREGEFQLVTFQPKTKNYLCCFIESPQEQETWQDPDQEMEWIIKGSTITVRDNGKKLAEILFGIDPTTKPKNISCVALENPKVPEPEPEWYSPYQAGIYLLDGNTLELCFGKGLEHRPTRFPTKPEYDSISYRFKRKEN
jgi:uncharacterized protein (TIGR03067 family)